METKSDAIQSRLEREIEEVIEESNTIRTPVTILVHDIDFINKRLSKAQYFFTDIKKQGILLYDAGIVQLKEAKELWSINWDDKTAILQRVITAPDCRGLGYSHFLALNQGLYDGTIAVQNVMRHGHWGYRFQITKHWKQRY